VDRAGSPCNPRCGGRRTTHGQAHDTRAFAEGPARSSHASRDGDVV